MLRMCRKTGGQAHGKSLKSHSGRSLASINKFFVVSSTRIQSTKIVDPLGEDVVSTGRFGNWLCGPINLDVDVIQGWQDINKLDAVRAKYGRRVNVTMKHDEAWAMVESLGSKSIKDIFAEFKIESSLEMLDRNAKLQVASRQDD